MTEPKTLHLKRPTKSRAPSAGTPAMAGGRRAVIRPEKRHGPAAGVVAPDAKKRGSQTGRNVVLAVFGAVVLGALVFALIHYMSEKRTAERRELYALKAERDKAEALFAGFGPLVERVTVMHSEAEGAETCTRDAVLFMTGQSLDAFTAPRKTPAAPRTRPGGSAVPSAAPSEPAPAPAREPEREVVDGREQPEGVESIAELERRRRQAQMERQGVNRPQPGAPPASPTPEAPAGNPPPSSSTGTVEPAEEPAPQPAAGAPEIVTLAVEIGRLTGDIREKREQVEATRGEAEAVGNATMRARTSQEAGRSATTLQEKVAAAEHLAGLAAASLDQVRSAVARANELRDAEERARQMREEAVRRRQAEEEHKALIEREKARAQELHTGARPLIERYDFTQARAELETARNAMQTDEGRAAGLFVVERFGRLQDMKESLIRYLNAKPFRWGWGSGAAAKDVNGADADSVDVVGGRVLWQDVSLPQMVKFVDHYQIDSTERLSVRADLAIGLAILLDELGRRAEATEYVRRARETGEYGQQAAREMLPDY